MKSDAKYKKWNLMLQEDDKRLREALQHLTQSEALIQDVLSRFSEDQGKTMITYQELSDIAFDIWLNVSPGVRFKRVQHPQKPLYFITEMHPELTKDHCAVFGLQQHDCKEICEIKTGHLIEILENNKHYSQGDKVFYPAFYKHKPSASVYSVYSVEFINEEN
jgi:hypothetical protein